MSSLLILWSQSEANGGSNGPAGNFMITSDVIKTAIMWPIWRFILLPLWFYRPWSSRYGMLLTRVLSVVLCCGGSSLGFHCDAWRNMEHSAAISRYILVLCFVNSPFSLSANPLLSGFGSRNILKRTARTKDALQSGQPTMQEKWPQVFPKTSRFFEVMTVHEGETECIVKEGFVHSVRLWHMNQSQKLLMAICMTQV